MIVGLIGETVTCYCGGYYNTYYGLEHDVISECCATGKTIYVVAAIFGINDANRSRSASTASNGSAAIDKSIIIRPLYTSLCCNFAVEDSVIGDSCIGKLKTFWLYWTCS
ncbi:unnamed protein product [Didymodactylos carnosus]|uniref:Uncharacterized protein n=1 Tax=Didymodactylos carnosus TaxID=1234261 RepID=A0A814N7V2_9BILA|nr:unnamed protein product [Didymodactylos carnosus]CAF3855312.1 unnamed protein product [Didymodactylos carnosus]